MLSRHVSSLVGGVQKSIKVEPTIENKNHKSMQQKNKKEKEKIPHESSRKIECLGVRQDFGISHLDKN